VDFESIGESSTLSGSIVILPLNLYIRKNNIIIVNVLGSKSAINP